VKLFTDESRLQIIDVYLRHSYVYLEAEDVSEKTGIDERSVMLEMSILAEADIIEATEKGDVTAHRLARNDLTRSLQRAQTELLSKNVQTEPIPDEGWYENP
jgi:DNA-binding transcriptional ArsR family regulator